MTTFYDSTITPLLRYSSTPLFFHYSSIPVTPCPQERLKRAYNLKITAAIARSPRNEINRMTTRGMTFFIVADSTRLFCCVLGLLAQILMKVNQALLACSDCTAHRLVKIHN